MPFRTEHGPAGLDEGLAVGPARRALEGERPLVLLPTALHVPQPPAVPGGDTLSPPEVPTRVAQPDLNPRRISKEPVFEYTMWYGIAIVAILIILSLVLSRRNASEG